MAMMLALLFWANEAKAMEELGAWFLTIGLPITLFLSVWKQDRAARSARNAAMLRQAATAGKVERLGGPRPVEMICADAASSAACYR